MRRTMTVRAVLPAALLLLLFAVHRPGAGGALPAYDEWRWSATGSMNTGRFLHTANLLLDGRVLVVGGIIYDENPAAAETYDPATGEWAATGDMAFIRLDHTSTLLLDGRVLAVGGRTQAGEALNSAELFDPATGAWTAVTGMHDARAVHAAALLPDGDVLVMGGEGDEGVTWSYERYDLASDTWTWGHMNKVRTGHTATPLLDGRVLVVGGYAPGNVAELYDPATGKWRYTGGRGVEFPDWSTATRLPDGRVMVTGENAAGLYDPISESWTGGYNGWQMLRHAAALMGDGRLMVSGGYDTSVNYPYELGYLDVTNVYDPASRSWNWGGSMTSYRSGHTATTLLDGRVLVAGGEASGDLDTAEVYAPFERPYAIYVPSVVWLE